MITLEDKLDIFYKIIYKGEEEKTKLALEELEKKHEDILETKKDELRQAKEKWINRKEAQAISEKNEMISQNIDENRKKSLIKREELLENLIQTLEIKAMNFTDQDEYEDFLILKIENSLRDISDEHITLGLKLRDKEKLESKIKHIEEKAKKKIELKELDENIIGGFKIWDIDKNYTLDNTFKTTIEENRYQIGKKLYIALDKQVK